MKCYKHNDVDAVSQCNVCGKALCSTCTNQFAVPICKECAQNEAVSDVSSLKTDLILGIIFLGLPWGWRVVNNILSFLDFMLFLPIAGWLIFKGIILVVSIVFGIIMYPFKIIYLIHKIKKSNQLLNYVNSLPA